MNQFFSTSGKLFEPDVLSYECKKKQGITFVKGNNPLLIQVNPGKAAALHLTVAKAGRGSW